MFINVISCKYYKLLLLNRILLLNINVVLKKKKTKLSGIVKRFLI